MRQLQYSLVTLFAATALIAVARRTRKRRLVLGSRTIYGNSGLEFGSSLGRNLPYRE